MNSPKTCCYSVGREKIFTRCTGWAVFYLRSGGQEERGKANLSTVLHVGLLGKGLHFS